MGEKNVRSNSFRLQAYDSTIYERICIEFIVFMFNS